MENNLQFDAALATPGYFTLPGPWVGHIPFAHWLVSVLRPSCLVELGTYRGNSYMNFCQSIADHKVEAKSYAVDTWKGDEHSGFYGEEIFLSLKSKHDPLYGGFSTLLRMTFDEARPRFSDRSIDLLHIDGLHTYEAVRHDFENWQRCLSDRAVVLFHDTDVHQSTFGVHRLWDELSRRYPSFKFSHSNGLGVLLVGTNCPQELISLRSDAGYNPYWNRAFTFFTTVGDALVTKAALMGSEDERRAEKEALKRSFEKSIESHKRMREALRFGYDRVSRLSAETKSLKEDCVSLKGQIERLLEEKATLLGEKAALHDRLQISQAETAAFTSRLEQLYSSTSWKVTTPARLCSVGLRKIQTLGRLLVSRDFTTIKERLGWQGHVDMTPTLAAEAEAEEEHPSLSAANATQSILKVQTVSIIATQHTMFVAHSIAKVLEICLLDVEISESMPDDFSSDLYIVICPQMFANLPPADKRISVQMEQSVSSRWFTERYISILKESMAVFDYSFRNLEFLAKHNISYPKTYYLPLGSIEGYDNWLEAHDLGSRDIGEQCDILFYGDLNERRNFILEKVSERYKVRVLNGLFGEQLRKAIRGAKVVLNIHYYEGALLETTRIYECLSLGARVVSEEGSDQEQHDDLRGIVSFAPVNDLHAILAKIEEVLSENEVLNENTAPSPEEKASANSDAFTFMLCRALFSLGLITFKQLEGCTKFFRLKKNALVLSMPETVDRRRHILSEKLPNVQIFDGIRSQPGWVGAAYSYKYIARKALSQGYNKILVYEDDAELSMNFEARNKLVLDYLERNEGDWDIFAGFIADLHPETKILKVEEVEGTTFVTIDRVVSMVYNIYGKRAINILSAWENIDNCVLTDSIDRFLEKRADLRVVTTLPFLVGHLETFHSSIWQAHNRDMVGMISASESLLAEKVWEYRARELIHEEINLIG